MERREEREKLQTNEQGISEASPDANDIYHETNSENKNGKVEVLFDGDIYRKYPWNLHEAILYCSYSAYDKLVLFYIYDRSYGYREKSTYPTTIRKIAKKLQVNHIAVFRSLARLATNNAIEVTNTKMVNGKEVKAYKIKVQFWEWLNAGLDEFIKSEIENQPGRLKDVQPKLHKTKMARFNSNVSVPENEVKEDRLDEMSGDIDDPDYQTDDDLLRELTDL